MLIRNDDNRGASDDATMMMNETTQHQPNAFQWNM